MVRFGIPETADIEALSRGAVLLHYRLFFFDGAGHIERAHEFEAESDERAIRIAEGWQEGRAMELWQRSGKVREWEPPPMHRID